MGDPIGHWPSPSHVEGEGREPRSIVLDALRGAVSRPAAWGAVLLVQALVAAIPALMTHEWLSRAMGASYAPGSLKVDLDALFRHDHKDSLAMLDAQVGAVGAALALASVLLGCFVAGGWLQVFLERTEGETLRRFALGGGRWFWRFARVAFLGLLLAGLCTWILRGPAWNHLVLSGLCGVPSADWSTLETLDSELSAWRLRFAQDLAHALGIAFIFAWGDWTRTRMALFDTNSAAWAGLCTMWTLVRHPLRTLGASATLFGVEAALLLLLGLLARSMEATIHRTGEAWPSIAMLILVLAGLLLRVVLRGARYHAAVHVSRQVVTPILRPDPWKDAVGGPGGPRYPIGGDEHLVQL